MKVIDNILLEWSYRCPDGVVDMNDPKKVKILKEILKPILKEDIDDDILTALSRLDLNDPKKEKILTYLTGDTKDEKDKEIETLKQQIAGSEKSKEEIAEKLYNIEQELISKNLKESTVSYIIYSFLKQNKENDLIKYFENEPKLEVKDGINIKSIPQNQLPNDIVNKLYNDLSGAGGTKGIGKEENFLVAFYRNVKKLEKRGDIEIDGQKYEVKGVGSMVTPSDIARGSKKNVTDLLTSEFLNKLELPLSTEFKSGEIWSQTISNLYKNYPDKPDFINKLQPVLNKKYPNLDINDTILKDLNLFTKEIAKNLISNFDVSDEEKIMFISPDGQIKIYNTKNDLAKDIDNGKIKISSFSDFIPRLTLPKEIQKEKVNQKIQKTISDLNLKFEKKFNEIVTTNINPENVTKLRKEGFLTSQEIPFEGKTYYVVDKKYADLLDIK